VERFEQLLQGTAVVGEIGLDFGSNYNRADRESQLRVFHEILKTVSRYPRLISIHSYQATEAVLEVLKEFDLVAPILHWWTGNVFETREAVDLGCYFSIHSAVARHSKFRNHVPVDRVLVETDHGYNDPPLGIPSRVEWVEHLVAQQYGSRQEEIKEIVWRNFSDLIEKTRTVKLLPKGITEIIKKYE